MIDLRSNWLTIKLTTKQVYLVIEALDNEGKHQRTAPETTDKTHLNGSKMARLAKKLRKELAKEPKAGT